MPRHWSVLLAWPSYVVWGRSWVDPQETRTAMVTADWSLAPTAMRDIANVDLLRRGIYPVSVCGWIGAEVANPAYCSTSSSCVWNSDYSIIGCCTTAGSDCAFYTSCIDLNSPQQVGDRSDIFTCRGTSVCYLNTYPNDYHQWGCGAASWATTVATSYPGMGDLSLQIVFTGTEAVGSVTDSASVTTILTTSTTLTSETPSLQSSPQSSPPSSSITSLTLLSTSQSSAVASSQSSSSSSDSRAIAIGGGVGGGIGGALLIGLVAAIFYRRFKKHGKQNIAQMDDINYRGHKPTIEEPVLDHERPVELPTEPKYELP